MWWCFMESVLCLTPATSQPAARETILDKPDSSLVMGRHGIKEPRSQTSPTQHDTMQYMAYTSSITAIGI
jgi:hypothetical protein